MHEAGVANRTLDAVLAAVPADRSGTPPRSLRVVVTDPAHLDVDAVSMHLEVALAERGWADVPLSVSSEPVACPACEAANRPEGAWPFCATCGAPLPESGGSGLEVTADW